MSQTEMSLHDCDRISYQKMEHLQKRHLWKKVRAKLDCQCNKGWTCILVFWASWKSPSLIYKRLIRILINECVDCLSLTRRRTDFPVYRPKSIDISEAILPWDLVDVIATYLLLSERKSILGTIISFYRILWRGCVIYHP